MKQLVLSVMFHNGLIILYNAGGRVCSDSDQRVRPPEERMSSLKLMKEQRTTEMKRNVQIEGQKHINGTRDAAIEVWAVGTQSCRPQYLLN
jgi:hypothetical protein